MASCTSDRKFFVTLKRGEVIKNSYNVNRANCSVAFKATKLQRRQKLLLVLMFYLYFISDLAKITK